MEVVYIEGGIVRSEVSGKGLCVGGEGCWWWQNWRNKSAFWSVCCLPMVTGVCWKVGEATRLGFKVVVGKSWSWAKGDVVVDWIQSVSK